MICRLKSADLLTKVDNYVKGISSNEKTNNCQ